MRQYIFAGFVLFAGLGGIAAAAPDSGWHLARAAGIQRYGFETGTAPTTGMHAGAATYFRTAGFNGACCVSNATLERTIPLAAWRGKRIHLSLRLKAEGDARAAVQFVIHNSDRTDLFVPAQVNAPGGAWQAHQSILDVPGNATDLTVTVALKVSKGRATGWVDDFVLETANVHDPLTEDVRRVAHVEPSDSWLNSTY